MIRKRLRILSIPLCVLIVAILATTPAAAAGYGSTTARWILGLNQMLLWIAIPLAILTEGALFYAAIKFHNNDDPKPTKDNRRLEITWTIGVAIILVFVSAASYVVLTHPMVSTQPGAMPTGNDLHVHITGQDWFWTFTYPKQHVTTTNTLVLPAHRTVFFTITSKDVDHSVWMPKLAIKKDAIPGRTNTYRTRLTKTGTYRLYDAQFDGTGHSFMRATVRVVTPKQYQKWLHRHQLKQGSMKHTRNVRQHKMSLPTRR